ncbi:MAG: hypothetical protein GWN58_53690, partial [Anaerolineae bacterium]|nr:hypothetical protein [Anaerolineae bacterium]
MNDNLESKRTSVESGLPAAGREHQQGANQLRKRIAALWVAVVALAVILSGVTGYGYLALHKHGLKLDDLPGLQES